MSTMIFKIRLNQSNFQTEVFQSAISQWLDSELSSTVRRGCYIRQHA